MTQYICAFYPKKAAAINGTTSLSTTVEAKNMKLAEMKAVMALEEVYPDSSDKYFKPKICEFVEGGGHPFIDAFDEQWLADYKWNESTREFDRLATSVILSEPACSAYVMEKETPKRVTLAELPAASRISYIMLYGATADEVDPERVSWAANKVNDDKAPASFRLIFDGLRHIATVKAMFIGPLAELIEALQKAICPNDKITDVVDFADKWINARPIEELVVHSSEVTLLEVLDDIETAIKGGMISPYPQHSEESCNPYFPIDDEDFDKLKIWKQACIIEPKDVELPAHSGQKPAVTFEFIIKRATELFGPVGIGWGYEIINEQMLDGQPISEHISDDDGPAAHTLLRDADGMLIFELNHLHLVKVWYIFEGVRAEVNAYGSAPYLSSSQEWITTSTGAHQESMRNAIRNGFSILGFGADVWALKTTPPLLPCEQNTLEPLGV